MAAAFIAGYLIYVIGGMPSQPAVEETAVSLSPENSGQEKKQTDKETLLVKDGFTVILPPGWQETPNFPEVLLMAVDAGEEIVNEKAREIGFRTNFSIKGDDLKKYDKEYSIEEYASSIKTALIQAISGIEFTYEDQGIINNNNAFFIECQSTQEEIDFKTLLVFIEGNDDIIWALSFNALQNSWSAYQDSFYQIAESFKN